jgi:hypothetical protein
MGLWSGCEGRGNFAAGMDLHERGKSSRFSISILGGLAKGWKSLRVAPTGAVPQKCACRGENSIPNGQAKRWRCGIEPDQAYWHAAGDGIQVAARSWSRITLPSLMLWLKRSNKNPQRDQTSRKRRRDRNDFRGSEQPFRRADACLIQ